jgi:hypothetical protein
MKITTGWSSVLAAAACCAVLLGAAALTGGAHAATHGTGYDYWADGGCKARAKAPVRIIRANGVRQLLLSGVQYCPAGKNHTLQICVAVGNALGNCNQVEKSGSTQAQSQNLLFRCDKDVFYESFARGYWWTRPAIGWAPTDRSQVHGDSDYSRPVRC